MKFQFNFFKAFIMVIGIIVLSFNVLLYNFCEKQKNELNAVRDKQDVESEFNSNKFKYQQDQIESISKDLGDAQDQIKDQKDQSNGIQTSLVDIKAETDAIKQDMKGWQKDYVTILAQLEKKMDDSQDGIKSVKESLDSLKSDIEDKAPATALGGAPSIGGASAVMTNETGNVMQEKDDHEN